MALTPAVSFTDQDSKTYTVGTTSTNGYYQLNGYDWWQQPSTSPTTEPFYVPAQQWSPDATMQLMIQLQLELARMRGAIEVSNALIQHQQIEIDSLKKVMANALGLKLDDLDSSNETKTLKKIEDMKQPIQNDGVREA